MKTKIFLVLAIATSAFFLGSSSAAATPTTGGFKATVLNKATLAKPTEIEGLGIHFATEDTTDIYVQQVDFPGKSTSGWHSHPGLVLVTVKSGSIVFHFGCRTEQFSAGQSFVEPPLAVGMAEDVVDAPAQVIATLVVPVGRAPRIDASAPVCG